MQDKNAKQILVNLCKKFEEGEIQAKSKSEKREHEDDIKPIPVRIGNERSPDRRKIKH